MKCSECRGVRHQKIECPNLQKSGDKSILCFTDTMPEDEEDNQDILLNFAALVGSEISLSDEDTSYSEDE